MDWITINHHDRNFFSLEYNGSLPRLSSRTPPFRAKGGKLEGFPGIVQGPGQQQHITGDLEARTEGRQTFLRIFGS